MRTCGQVTLFRLAVDFRSEATPQCGGKIVCSRADECKISCKLQSSEAVLFAAATPGRNNLRARRGQSHPSATVLNPQLHVAEEEAKGQAGMMQANLQKLMPDHTNWTLLHGTCYAPLLWHETSGAWKCSNTATLRME